ncbi:MAG: FtsQ-type POTRA domain-containing protein [Bacilli bacterium]
MKQKKVKVRKFNILKFLIIILFLYLIVSACYKVINLPIKNIYIFGNDILEDYEIINSAKIETYPSFIRSYSYKIKKNIMKLKLIKSVKVKKKLFGTIEIYVTERKVLFKEDNVYTLEGNITYKDKQCISPILVNFVPLEVKKKLIDEISLINKNILNKISEIEYNPSSYDEERFILYMNDKNLIYITLNKIDVLNRYNDIIKKLDGHEGILYLDSGNYFEIRK